MLDLVDASADREVVALEPACGNGTFLVELLRRRLAASRPTEALVVAASVRGIDIDPSNVSDARGRMYRAVINHLTDRLPEPGAGLACSSEFGRDLAAVLESNITVGDFLDPQVRDRLPRPELVVGGPPSDGFVHASIDLGPSDVVMVTPDRWLANLPRPTRLTHLVHHPDSRDVSGSVEIEGGVSWFRWSATHEGPCEFTVVRDGVVGSESLALQAPFALRTE